MYLVMGPTSACPGKYQVSSCFSSNGRWCGLWFQDLMHVVRRQPGDMLVSVARGKSLVWLAFLFWEIRSELEVLHREGICSQRREQGLEFLGWFPSEKIDNAANFTLKKVSVLTITCTHTGCDTFHGGKLTFLREWVKANLINEINIPDSVCC